MMKEIDESFSSLIKKTRSIDVVRLCRFFSSLDQLTKQEEAD